MYIDDCVYGTRALMDSDVTDPINFGSSQLVTIDELVDIVEAIAGVTLKRHYDLSAPKGVRGRNSDNTMIKQSSAGSRRFGSRTVWSKPTPGSMIGCARDIQHRSQSAPRRHGRSWSLSRICCRRQPKSRLAGSSVTRHPRPVATSGSRPPMLECA